MLQMQLGLKRAKIVVKLETISISPANIEVQQIAHVIFDLMCLKKFNYGQTIMTILS